METIISVSGLTKAYNNNVVLDNVSLSLKRGKVYGIIGKNGSGKSTLIQCVLGLIPWEKGTISMFGKEIKYNVDRKYIFSYCSAVLQDVNLPKKLKVSECLKLFSVLGEYKGNYNSIVEMLELKEQLNKKYEELSYGQKQKLLLATALLQKAQILFLDEPTNGIDENSRNQIFQFIKQLKKENMTIVIISHRKEDISCLCDEVVEIDNKKLTFNA